MLGVTARALHALGCRTAHRQRSGGALSVKAEDVRGRAKALAVWPLATRFAHSAGGGYADMSQDADAHMSAVPKGNEHERSRLPCRTITFNRVWSTCYSLRGGHEVRGEVFVDGRCTSA